jgi:hypothetical protein
MCSISCVGSRRIWLYNASGLLILRELRVYKIALGNEQEIQHAMHMFKTTMLDQRRETQQRMPERTRNHIEPIKRNSDRPAVAHRMTLKYHVVRTVDVFYTRQHLFIIKLS